MNSLPFFMRINFEGRLNRWRYFWFSLPLSLLFMLPVSLLIRFFESKGSSILSPLSWLLNILWFLYILSLEIRRLHDLNHSGWLCLITITPVINIFFILYLTFAKGTGGPNKYGPDPLEYENYEDYLTVLRNPNVQSDSFKSTFRS